MARDDKNRKYKVVRYDPKWKDQFAQEAKILSSIFGKSALAIEHIGGTAVPKLSGKPTIDVLILVKDIAIADTVNQKMVLAGFKSLGEYVMPGTRLFAKEENNTRLCNVHVFPDNHPHAKEMLHLRDYFRCHAELVEEYSKLKFDLMRKYRNDYGLYRKYKDEWMGKLIEGISDKLSSSEDSSSRLKSSRAHKKPLA